MVDFVGTASDDVFTGGGSNDTATGNGGNDQLSGGSGDDDLSGGAGSDTLNGDDGDDVLYSGERSPPFSQPYYNNPYMPPLLDTGSEVDTLNGGNGSDRLFAGYGDNVDGGAGGSFGDTLYISFLGAPTGITFDFSLATQTIGGGTITGIENVGWIQGSNFADNLSAAGQSNGYSPFTAIFGMGGNDTLTAGYYTGVLDGGDGDDTVDGRGSQYLQNIYGGSGNDTLYTNSNTFAVAWGGDGNDTINAHGEIHGGSGNDIINQTVSYYSGSIYGDDGADEIRAVQSSVMSGGSGGDRLFGSSNNDLLVSHDFGAPNSGGDDIALDRDIITAGDGSDTVWIGQGDDADGGAGTDNLNLSFAGSASGITFTTSNVLGSTPFTFAGGTIVNFENFVRLRGSELADDITISGLSSLIIVDGGAGNDVVRSTSTSADVRGGAGDDRFFSGIAGDIFDGGAGTDTIDYSGYASGVTITFGLSAGQTGAGAGGDQIINVENIDGSAFADTISGSNSANVVRGLAGDDVLRGLGGDDTLDGGDGNDRLDGGAGIDAMSGGTGNDIYVVDSISDTVTDSSGDDIVEAQISYTLGVDIEGLLLTGTAAIDGTGNASNNVITGNSGSNILTGGDGNDTLDGGDGNDRLIGGVGADTLAGGLGNDVFIIEDNSDTLSDVGGTDRVEASISYSLAADFENLTLTGVAAINGTGNGLNNSIAGNSAANIIDAGAGDDIIDGGAGADTMSGGTGNDQFIVDNAGDIVDDSAGTDVVLSSVTYALGAAIEELRLTGTAAIDGTGNASDNIIVGNSADNRLDGGAGIDQLYGGLGNDDFFVDQQGDVLFENANQGLDRVFSSDSFYLYANIENLTLTGTANSFGVGNELANVLTGNSGENLLIAGAGNDTVNGGGARDAIFGEDGADTLNGEAGIDYIVAGIGNDTLDGGADADEMYGQEGDDIMRGGASFDTDIIVGGLGNDTIYGNSGLGDYDRLYGNEGNDIFYVDTPDDLVFEQGGEGTDTVYADINGAGYYLYGNIENLILLDDTPFGVGNDLDNRLTGSATGNYLLGGAGNDTLNGLGGNDVLFGETGNDVFVFNQGTGGDVIGDFARGQDRIDVSAYGMTFAQLQARFVQNGNVGAIQMTNGDVIVLHDVTMSQLTASDFILAPVAEALPKSEADIGGAFGMLLDPVDAMAFAGHGLQRWGMIRSDFEVA